MRAFEKRLWEVTEHPFHPEKLPHTETIFTIGNGLVGVRGSFEEGYPHESDLTLAHGIYNHKANTLVPELVALPNWFALRIRINGEDFRMNRGRLMGYHRTLDLKTGILWRGVLWQSPDQETVVRFAFERFTSLNNPHVLALQVLIQVLNEGQHTLEITSLLDGTVVNPPEVDHWQTLTGGSTGDTLEIHGLTDQSGYTVAMRGQTLLSEQAAWHDVSSPRTPAHQTTFTVAQNQKIQVTKLVALHTSRDSNDPRTVTQATLQQAVRTGYESLKSAHIAAWADYWQDMDVQIDGDEVAQQAIRFNLYHLLIAAPTTEERVSIGAKTLSGHGYKGHVFWDTELFMVPPFTLSRPDFARRLLMYRYHNLAGARHKAAEAGYEGAMFPWESTDTGEETTPRLVTDAHGREIRIWTGDNEQHISTDIAYAVMQFWRWTGDDGWFRQYGAELVLDTAKFWGSRAEYNADKDRYELRMQIGPDEYHENVDNSVFTNRMVVWHLQTALDVWAWLEHHTLDDATRLQQSLGLTSDMRQQWQTIAEKMWIPQVDGVLEQFENFFERLKPINLEDYTPRVTNMDVILGHEKTQRFRVIKQADVVMLMALLGKDLGDDDFLQRNWELYSKVVDHGSSLSPSIHAMVAARLNRVEEAYENFIYAATVDLADLKGNVHDGIHAASCGGVWQAVVFGFCGLALRDDGSVTTHPCLPEHWRRVSFKIYHQGKPVTIVLPKG